MEAHDPEESGTFFVLPPHRRLFGVFDDPDTGSAVATELRDAGAPNDVWTFYGDRGVRSVDPHAGHHGMPVAVVRALQRFMTSDCEYCEGLAAALRNGDIVLAVRVDHVNADTLAARLSQRGAHSLAYGEHWNFVPVEGATHSIGYFSGEGAGSESSTSDSEGERGARRPRGSEAPASA